MGDTSLVVIDQSILVVVDIQQRLTSAMEAAECQRVINTSAMLLQAANALTIPVIVTEQYPKGLGSTVPELTNLLADTSSVIEKTCFSCLQSHAFNQHLTALNRKQVILVGMESHICIMQTALDLIASGYQVFVVEDGVCSRSINNKTNALQRLRQHNMCISNSESVLFEWLGDAKHPQFKALSKLII